MQRHKQAARRRTVGFAGIAVSCGIVAAGVTAERLHAAAPGDGKPSGRSAPAAAADVPLTEDQKIVHVLNRLGFGARPGDIERVRAMGLSKYIDAQLHPESVDDSVVDKKLTEFPLLATSGDDLARIYAARQGNNRKIKEQVQAIQGDKAGKPGGAGATTADGQDATMSPAGMPGMPMMTANGAAQDAQKLRAQVMANATPEQREQLRTMYASAAKSAQAVSDVEIQTTVAKAMRAIESERQLQEVMVDFWGNHFNIDLSKQQCATLKTADDRDVIRPHALGKFRDLLEASAKSPAMLVYLDNYQSTSPHLPGGVGGGAMGARLATLAANPNLTPAQQRRLAAFRQRMAAQAAPAKGKKGAGGLNENYGREIMELHTLGVDGGYTQKDVTEVARCFTGWSLARISPNDPNAARKTELGGTFQFYPALHDEGAKTVLGHVIPAGGGINDGEKVLDILASNPATMRHVSTELCQRLVADTPPTSLVDKCVATWEQTDGDIREIVRTIVTSPEFYSRAVYGKKIKSPFEYAVSSVRALGGTCDVSPALLRPVQRRFKKDGTGLYGSESLLGQITAMGEPVFRYQAPTGYPEDSHKWVSAGALISRLNFSLVLANGKLTAVQLPDLDNEVAGLTGPAQIVDRLSNSLLHAPVSASTRSTLLAQVNGGESAAGDAHAAASDLSLTRRLTALLLGSPEFQRR